MSADLFRGFSWILSGRIALLASGLVTTALINRVLGPEGRGVLAEAQTWVALFATLFSCGLDSAIYHFANRGQYQIAAETRALAVVVLSTLISILAGCGLLAFVVVWPEYVSYFVSQSTAVLMALVAATVFAANVTVFAQAEGRVAQSAMAALAQAAFNMTVVVIGYQCGWITIDYVIITILLSQIVPILLLSKGIVTGGVKTLRDTVAWVANAQSMVRLGLRQHIATLATFGYMKINQLIVFHFSGEKEAGLFAASMALASAFGIVLSALQTALYPRVINSDDDVAVTVKAMRLTLVLGGIAVTALSLLAEPILLVYGGANFVGAVTSFRLLLVAVWLLAFNSLLAPLIVKLGAFKIATISAILLGVISIGINLALVPVLHGNGAALATTITTMFGFLMILGMFRMLTGRSPITIFWRSI
jgi:O-antigen/teichoic acid export membrane protein